MKRAPTPDQQQWNILGPAIVLFYVIPQGPEDTVCGPRD